MYTIYRVPAHSYSENMTDQEASRWGVVVTGVTTTDCLNNLITAINADDVDTDNCFLRLVLE